MHLWPAALSITLFLIACVDRESARPAELRDDFGAPIALSARPPERIVSLNPATTDLLFALHAGPRLVGRTQSDSYPDSARLVPDVGSGMRPNVEAVLARRPDLVVLYASDENRAAAAQLRGAGVRTVSLRIDLIADFQRAAALLGRIVGDAEAGRVVADSVTRTLERVRQATSGRPRPTVFWRIWDSPLITIGRRSFLHELVVIAGGRNIYEDFDVASPQVALEDVVRRDPDVILVGPEGRDRLMTDAGWRALSAVREGRLLVVDTLIVGRPSVRLGEAAVHIARLLHPDVSP